MNLLQQFIERINGQHFFAGQHKLLLAVSGGLDSIVLMDLCKKAGFQFSVAHCNFQLRAEESNRDEQFVKNLAEKYQAAFFSISFNTTIIAKQQKTSIEETARNLRYAWFMELLTMRDDKNRHQFACVATAHHANDNIETVAMNFFRGTGIKGLSGIESFQGKILRPLLFAKRNDLETYVQTEGLVYVFDSSNSEDIYTRNFFRNRILPLVQQVYPEAENNLLKNIERFAEVEELYVQAINLHKKKLLEQRNGEWHIPVLKLKKLTALQTIVYEIIKDFGFSASQTNAIVDLLESETGKYVASATHRIIRNRNWLIIAPKSSQEVSTALIEETDRLIEFPEGQIKMHTLKGNDLHLPSNNNIVVIDSRDLKFPLLLRRCKTGDYFYPLGMKKKKKLSRFFIDLKLSKTEKENVWVLESDKRIVWVLGHRIDDRFKVVDSTKEMLQLEWARK